MGCSDRNLGLGTQAEVETSSSRQRRGNLGAKQSLHDQNRNTRATANHLNIELGSFKKPLMEGRAPESGAELRLLVGPRDSSCEEGTAICRRRCKQ